MGTNELISNMEEVSLPRTNGELVFRLPWEARSFGIAVALNAGGLYEWEDFTANLVAEISSAEDYDVEAYYEKWLSALEQIVVDQGLLSKAEFVERLALFSQQEHPGHSH